MPPKPDALGRTLKRKHGRSDGAGSGASSDDEEASADDSTSTSVDEDVDDDLDSEDESEATVELRRAEFLAARVPKKKKPRARSKEEEERILQRKLEHVERVRNADLFQTPGDWQPGDLFVRFVRVGQGDCILLKTPGGKVVVVDCGTNDDGGMLAFDNLRFVKDSVLAPPFFIRRKSVATAPGTAGTTTAASTTTAPPPGNIGVIDVLVITHPDLDHYNLLSSVFEKSRFRVRRAYLTDSTNKYSQSGTSEWLDARCGKVSIVRYDWWRNAAGTPVGEISLSSRAGKKSFYDPSAGFAVVPRVAASPHVEQLDALHEDGGIRIVDEPDFRLSILAANVREDHSARLKRGGDTDGHPTKAKNRRSIVTLAEFGLAPDGTAGRSLLLLGDATRSTEIYLSELSPFAVQNRARFSRVTVAQIAHHGSSNTSSDEGFVNLFTGLQQAVCSTGNPGVGNHYLPRWTAIRRWAAVVQGRTARDHSARVWRSMTDDEMVAARRTLAPAVAPAPTPPVVDDGTAPPSVALTTVGAGVLVTVDGVTDDDLLDDDATAIDPAAIDPAAGSAPPRLPPPEDDGSNTEQSTSLDEVTGGKQGRKFVRKNLRNKAVLLTGTHGNVDLHWSPPAGGR